MTAYKPVVMINGQLQNLSSSDTLAATCADIDIYQMTNGEAAAVTIGAPVYAAAAGSFKKAIGTALLSSRVVGLVATATVPASAAGSVQTDGVITATTAAWDALAGTTGGLTAGAVYYLSSTTAGQLTAVAPSTAGQYVVPIGTALSSTDLLIGIEKPFAL